MLLSAPVQGFRLEGRGGGGGWGFYLFIGRFSASSPLRLCEEGRGLEEWIPPSSSPTHTHTHPSSRSPLLAVFPPSGDTPASVHINIHQSMVLQRGTSLCPTESHIHAWIHASTRTFTHTHIHKRTRQVHTQGWRTVQQQTHPQTNTQTETPSVSVNPTSAPAFSCAPTQFCLYSTFKLDSFPLSPAMSLSYKSVPVLYLISRCIWTSLYKNLRMVGKQTEEKGDRGEEKVCASEGWDGALCWFLSSLCEVLSAPSLSLLAHRMGGELRLGLDERGISLTKSVSTTKRRLHQIPLILTHWCHTHHSPALNCCVKKNALICQRHISFFFFCQQA